MNLNQDVSDAERVDRIRALEELKSALAAAQARETAAFVDSQRAAQQAAGIPARKLGLGVAAQVALARRISPYRASRYVGWAKILTTELPRTFRALSAGRVSEWRALILARETIWLSREDRAAVDTRLAPRLESLSDRQVEAEARKIAYELDPGGFVERLRGAEADRHVSLRPAPECMARLSALLPVAQGVAVHAALTRAAAQARSAGDDRGRGQVMADTLVERVTGQATATDVPLEINVVMTDQALFNAGDRPHEPARLLADGVPAATVPAELARRAATDPSRQAAVFLRRLYIRPADGQLASMDSRRRLFAGNLRKFLLLRDQTCRTPWCDAPIRHTDHVNPAANGGPTSSSGGQGLCEACNYAKQAAGWRQLAVGSEIVTVTPTGHYYRGSPPRPPGWARPPSPLELIFREQQSAA